MPCCSTRRFQCLFGLLALLLSPVAIAHPVLPWVKAQTRGLDYAPYFLSAIQQPAFDVGSNPGVEVRFGHAVALDGDWLLVGVPRRLNVSGQRNGAVFLYQRQGASWVQRQRIQFGVGGDAQCGYAVALKNNVAVIGCPGHSSGGLEGRGRVLIYRLDPASGLMSSEQTVLGSAVFEECGYSVAVDGSGQVDDTYVAIGCIARDAVAAGSYGGVSLYRYGQSGGSAEWLPWGELSPSSEGIPQAGFWRFGAALSIERLSGPSPLVRLLVGMPGGRPDGQMAAGLAFLYERPTSGGAWTQVRRFARPDASQEAAAFGHAVSLSGGQVAIGAPGAGHNATAVRSGMVYRYVRLQVPGGAASWVAAGSIGADMAALNPSGGGRFGHAVALSGADLWIGQPFRVDAESAGAVWRHRASATLPRLWSDIHQRSVLRQEILGDELGFALGLDRRSNRIAVGAPESASTSLEIGGLAFIYDASDRLFADRLSPDRLLPGAQFRDCEDCPMMVTIPAGSFIQGSPVGEPDGEAGERPQRQVNLAAFAMGQTEVSFAEWDACVSDGGCTHIPGDNGWGRGDRPVMNVGWDDAQQYVAWLSARTGRAYRLPSESEWEYATRAGTTGRFHTGDCINTDEANFSGLFPALGCADGIARFQALPVGLFAPNDFGLYDTHGNVREWTQDCWNENYSGAPTQGSAWLAGDCSRAVVRGGAFGADGGSLRSAYRLGLSRGLRAVDVGFRIARSVTP